MLPLSKKNRKQKKKLYLFISFCNHYTNQKENSKSFHHLYAVLIVYPIVSRTEYEMADQRTSSICYVYINQ